MIKLFDIVFMFAMSLSILWIRFLSPACIVHVRLHNICNKLGASNCVLFWACTGSSYASLVKQIVSCLRSQSLTTAGPVQDLFLTWCFTVILSQSTNQIATTATYNMSHDGIIYLSCSSYLSIIKLYKHYNANNIHQRYNIN